MKKIFFTFCIIGFFSSFVSADESLLEIKQRLEHIERNINDLQKVLFSKKNSSQPSENNIQDESSQITVFDMRLRDIENDLKAINLNYENMSFEIEELINALEGLSLNLNNNIITQNNEMQKLSLKIDSNLLPENNEKEIVADTSSDSIKNNDLENLSNDENTLGTLKISSNDLSEPSTDSIEQDEPNNELSPEEQFQLAYDYLRSQKLDKAKSLLELFIKNHPSHVLAGLAQYWLGEVIYLNKEYRQAAIVFSEGYQKYPESVKAPESLYKLAESLIKIEKKDDACATLNQFLIKYPNHELIKKIKLKIDDLQCS